MNYRISADTMKSLQKAQKNEITEYHIYSRLSSYIKNEYNSNILKQIAMDEHHHYNVLKTFTGTDKKPNSLKILFYTLISLIFGITFGIKLMERGEKSSENLYRELGENIDEFKRIADEEDKHEKGLVEIIEEERLKFVSSMVLGLNDALVELTGTLAGLTFALKNTRLIALAGLITGISASLSMATSEYLSTRTEEDNARAFKSALYTGGAYVFTVVCLVLPYLIFSNYVVSLVFTIIAAILIILVFNFYISVAKGLSFKERFFEMAGISLGVAVISFIIGYFIRLFLGVDI
ncbi:VIT1/CCC1 family predicted Fe2+/Mn2+ transporter [Herbinix hemicellulosilytica]|uniref:Putative membrane protein n=1 Tax=Herbinix hemicellulosilytica TaxID=1564487 RepID=A0A0H5SG73_HERHM|nr:VIT1/CCC1 transporter family protein [Herbinix hemicellulosilytica]RBP58959.1 VIT1/CCC1 family predicted Fe2+/Mn2+ transporter [Herbinix hemicellulosilytica]CRZ34015.1 putative membrane protein [Herbinix hemicellulosilytica]